MRETTSQVKLVSITRPVVSEDVVITPEQLIVGLARISSPRTDEALYEDASQLIRYCFKNHHWSIFEMVDMTVYIRTTLAITPQFLRHRSFCFQQFSLRYAESRNDYELYEPRKPHKSNRQMSVPLNNSPESDALRDEFFEAQQQVIDNCNALYHKALENGIAKESARMLLPMGTQTGFYMKGSVRSWIHYLMTRLEGGTQKEHRDVALQIFNIFCEHFPIIAKLIELEQEMKGW